MENEFRVGYFEWCEAGHHQVIHCSSTSHHSADRHTHTHFRRMTRFQRHLQSDKKNKKINKKEIDELCSECTLLATCISLGTSLVIDSLLSPTTEFFFFFSLSVCDRCLRRSVTYFFDTKPTTLTKNNKYQVVYMENPFIFCYDKLKKEKQKRKRVIINRT